MRIASIRVQNFRSLEDVTLNSNTRTVLIGANGAGKSSLLRALQMFYEPTASYTKEDFYNREIDREICVRVTYTDLDAAARERFSSYIAGDNLSVEKVMKSPDNKSNQRYYGKRLTNRDFQGFRNASGQGYRNEYNALQDAGYDLPEYQNKDEAEAVLRQWEEEHADECERQRDDGEFFGFNPVGKAALEEFTQFILIPAVRDAAEDAREGRGSALTDLMDLVVRATLSEREDFDNLRTETQREYEDIIDNVAQGELSRLEANLSMTLETFAPGAEVDLGWITEDLIDIPLPKATIRLRQENFSAAVEHSGHGLQRAFIITLLQHLAVREQLTDDAGTEDEEEAGAVPSLILGIEEPELYQHPNRQRHLADIITSFGEAGVSGVASSVQVLYSTHSPLLVDIRAFDDVRAVRKRAVGEEVPSVTEVHRNGLEDVTRRLEQIHGEDRGTFTAESTRARLESVMTPWVNEGFFADVAVLVEGIQDRAAIIGQFNAEDINLQSNGVAVIPVGGKTKLCHPAIIFKNLGIDVYLVFDGDRGEEGEEENNRILLRLLGEEERDWPEGVYSRYACFNSELADAVKASLGEGYYYEKRDNVSSSFGFSKPSRAEKNPAVMEKLFRQAASDGRVVTPIQEIVERISELTRDGQH